MQPNMGDTYSQKVSTSYVGGKGMGGVECTTELSMLAPPVTWNTAKYGDTYWQKVDLMLEGRGGEGRRVKGREVWF